MIDEAKQDLATRYVLGELNSASAAEFQMELDEDTELLQLVFELQETFAEVALEAVPQRPPPELFAQILLRLQYDAPAVNPEIESKIVRPNWIPWALAACLAITCTLLFADRSRLHREVLALHQRDALSQMRIATLNAQTEAYEKVLAVVVWDEEKQRGVVKLDHLAVPAPDRDYQLWMIAPNQATPVSAGVISVDENRLTEAVFRPAHAVRSVSKFALSIERKGGAPAPEGPIILIGN